MPCGYLKNLSGVSRKLRRGGGSKNSGKSGIKSSHGGRAVYSYSPQEATDTPRFGYRSDFEQELEAFERDLFQVALGFVEPQDTEKSLAPTMGLSIRELTSLQHRELSPEDYELLLRLDEAVEKKVVKKTLVDQLRSRTAGEQDEETCCVCLADIEVGDKMKITECNHCFHKDCIEKWLTTCSTVCPKCSQECTGRDSSKDSGKDYATITNAPWACEACTFVNEFLLANCELCTSPKPTQRSPPPQTSSNTPPASALTPSTSPTASPSVSPCPKKKRTKKMKLVVKKADPAEVFEDIIFQKEFVHLPQREKKRWDARHALF